MFLHAGNFSKMFGWHLDGTFRSAYIVYIYIAQLFFLTWLEQYKFIYIKKKGNFGAKKMKYPVAWFNTNMNAMIRSFNGRAYQKDPECIIM